MARRRKGLQQWLVAGLALAILLSGVCRAWAQQAEALKAAFVLNFLKFAEWPAPVQVTTNTLLTIAAIGDDSLAAALKQVLDGKQVQGRRVEVRFFRDAAEWKAAGGPGQALFVAATMQDRWSDILGELAGRPVLTISETPGFCARGGMLNLFEKESRIRFEANPGAVEKEGLKLRSELLKLATIAKTEGK